MSTELRYFAYVTTQNDGGKTLIKFDYDGTEQWSVTFANDAQGVAVDHLGYVYVGTNGGDLYKFDPNGTQLWSLSVSSNSVTTVAVDYPDRNVYYGTSGGDVASYTTDGATLRWSQVSQGVVNQVALQPVGFETSLSSPYVFAVTDGSDLIKYDSADGTIQWTYTSTNSLKAVAVEYNGDAFVGGSNSAVEKIDTTGSQVWITSFGNSINSITTNRSTDEQYVYGGDNSGTIKKLNSGDGSEVWQFSDPSSQMITGLSVDGEGKQWSPYGEGIIWVGAQTNFYKLNETGAQTGFSTITIGDQITRIDTDPVPRALIDESEDANASDTFVSNVLADYPDGAGGGDTYTQITSVLKDILEDSGGGDTFAQTAQEIRVIEENAGGGDTLSNNADTSHTLSFGANASDTESSNVLLDYLDGVGGGNTLTQTSDAPVIIDTGAGGAETITQLSDATPILEETANAGEPITVIASTSVIWNDGSGGGESIFTDISTSPNMIESAGGGDGEFADAATGIKQVESAAAADMAISGPAQHVFTWDEAVAADTSEDSDAQAILELVGGTSGADIQDNSANAGAVSIIDTGANAGDTQLQITDSPSELLAQGLGGETVSTSNINAPSTYEDGAGAQILPSNNASVDTIIFTQDAGASSQEAAISSAVDTIVSTGSTASDEIIGLGQATNSLFADAAGNINVFESSESASELLQTAGGSLTQSQSSNSPSVISESALGDEDKTEISSVTTVVDSGAHGAETMDDAGTNVTILYDDTAQGGDDPIVMTANGNVDIVENGDANDIVTNIMDLIVQLDEQASSAESNVSQASTGVTTIPQQATAQESAETVDAQAIVSINETSDAFASIIGLGQHPFDFNETVNAGSPIVGLGDGIVNISEIGQAGEDFNEISTATPLFEQNAVAVDITVSGPAQHTSIISSASAADSTSTIDAQALVILEDTVNAVQINDAPATTSFSETFGALADSSAAESTAAIVLQQSDANISDTNNAFNITIDVIYADNTAAADFDETTGTNSNEDILGKAGAPDEGMFPQSNSPVIVSSDVAGAGDLQTEGIIAETFITSLAKGSDTRSAVSQATAAYNEIADAIDAYKSFATVTTDLVLNLAMADDDQSNIASVTSGVVESITADDDAPTDDVGAITDLEGNSTGDELVDALASASEAIVKGAAANEQWVATAQHGADLITGATADMSVNQWEIQFIDELISSESDAGDQFINAVSSVAELQGHANSAEAFLSTIMAVVDIGEPAQASSILEAINVSTIANIGEHKIRAGSLLDAVVNFQGSFLNVVDTVDVKEIEAAQVQATTKLEEKVKASDKFTYNLTKLTGFGRVLVGAITISGTISGINTIA